MPASAFSWQVTLAHCPSGVCHSHRLQTYSGVTSGSFSAPDHEFPSHLLLTVTVTDSGGLTDTRPSSSTPRPWAHLRELADRSDGDPDGADHPTPYTETFIQGSQFNVTAAPTTTPGNPPRFASWSDGGARTHAITAPTTPTTYTAAYNRPTGRRCRPTRRRAGAAGGDLHRRARPTRRCRRSATRGTSTTTGRSTTHRNHQVADLQRAGTTW